MCCFCHTCLSIVTPEAFWLSVLSHTVAVRVHQVPDRWFSPQLSLGQETKQSVCRAMYMRFYQPTTRNISLLYPSLCVWKCFPAGSGFKPQTNTASSCRQPLPCPSLSQSDTDNRDSRLSGTMNLICRLKMGRWQSSEDFRQPPS